MRRTTVNQKVLHCTGRFPARKMLAAQFTASAALLRDIAQSYITWVLRSAGQLCAGAAFGLRDCGPRRAGLSEVMPAPQQFANV